MLVYVTLATDRMEPRESARICAALAIVPANMTPDRFEGYAREAGFEIATVDRIDSEWREHALENGDQWGALSSLLRVARMRRREEKLSQRYGQSRYEAAHASDLWGIYQFLGKLCPTIYLLRKPAVDADGADRRPQ
jgi:hypothetical protein